MNRIYQNCQYLSSAYHFSQLPADQGHEVAFAGRSNAGKSSAINAITHSKHLAKVGRKPGRTQTINLFTLTPDHALVDLPGYGYAAVPAAVQNHWQRTLQRYFNSRQALRGLIVVMDIRHPLQAMDWQLVEWCAQANLPIHVLLTKSDKLSKNAALNQLHKTTRELEQANIHASLQLFSALKKTGIEDAQSVVNQWLQLND